MTDLAKEVTEFLLGERSPFRWSKEQVAWLVWDTSRRNPAWGPATLPEWQEAVRDAVKRGLMIEKDGTLGFPEPVKTEPEHIQLGLFE